MTKKILKIIEKVTLKRIFNIALVAGFFSFIFFYTIFNTKFLIRGIDLQIEGIENGKNYNVGWLNVTGNARRSIHLQINGRELNIDEEGNFEDVLILLPGYNIVTVTAEDRFGKVTKKIFEVGRILEAEASTPEENKSGLNEEV